MTNTTNAAVVTVSLTCPCGFGLNAVPDALIGQGPDGVMWAVCDSCGAHFEVSVDAVRHAQHLCLVALGEAQLYDPAEWTAEALAGRMQADILKDIHEGRVPSTVSGFEDLHDYCDANEYGGLCDSDCPLKVSRDADVAIINAAQNLVNDWLAKGGHR